MFKVLDKYVSRSRACVLDNRDPKQRGRIIVDHPQLGETAWIPYLKTPGLFDVPEVGDIVFVEAESGKYEYPVAWGNITKGLDEAPDLPAVFRREVPTNRGLYSPAGHQIELDDGIKVPDNNAEAGQQTTEGKGIKITTADGNKIHIFEDTDAGQQFILLEDINGNFVKLDYAANKITISSTGTSQFSTQEDKSEFVGANEDRTIDGNKDETIGGNLTIDVTGNVTINCAQATVSTTGDLQATVGGAATVDATGDVTLDAGGDIILTAAGNTVAPGGVVTDNTVNNDPITGIPLTAVGGTDAN